MFVVVVLVVVVWLLLFLFLLLFFGLLFVVVVCLFLAKLNFQLHAKILSCIFFLYLFIYLITNPHHTCARGI